MSPADGSLKSAGKLVRDKAYWPIGPVWLSKVGAAGCGWPRSSSLAAETKSMRHDEMQTSKHSCRRATLELELKLFQPKRQLKVGSDDDDDEALEPAGAR